MSGPGIPDADFLLYVTANSGSNCGEGTAAYAHHCEIDIESNRPLSGTINLCPSFFKQGETLLQQIETVLHEVLHALVRQFWMKYEHNTSTDFQSLNFKRFQEEKSRMVEKIILPKDRRHEVLCWHMIAKFFVYTRSRVAATQWTSILELS